MRAILIAPERAELSEADLDMSIDALQAAVGGLIETAHVFDNGDVLYVDENGLSLMGEALQGRAEAAHAFMFDIGAHQPFAGRGVIVGVEDGQGRHGSAVSSLEDIAARLSFLAPPLAVMPFAGSVH